MEELPQKYKDPAVPFASDEEIKARYLDESAHPYYEFLRRRGETPEEAYTRVFEHLCSIKINKAASTN